MIFLSYAKEDEKIAEKIYYDLKNHGYDVWFSKVSLFAGQKWKAEIKKAIKNSKLFVALLSSKSVTKQGYVQNELKAALEVLESLPETEVFIIPLRIEECSPTHEKLLDIHWVDLFPSYENGIEEILRSCKYRLCNISISLSDSQSQDKKESNRIKALFVEDEASATQPYFWRLTKIGFDCILAQTGDEAVEELRKRKYDIISLDIMFPPGRALGENISPIKAGLRLLEMIRAGQIENCNKDIDVIVLTARMHQEIESQIKAFGISAYLQKPIEYSNVIETFSKLKEKIKSQK